MTITDDWRVPSLAAFSTDCCYDQRTDYYSTAMRKVGANRGQIGGLLYEVNRVTHDWLGGLLLTSVIRKKDQDWPGDGYFSCAADFGLLAADTDKPTQRAFWHRQLRGLFTLFADPQRVAQAEAKAASDLRMRRTW